MSPESHPDCRAADNVAFTVSGDGKSITATGDAFIATSLLQVVGIPTLQVAGYSEGEIARATVSSGGSGGSNIEISVMLDVTGSMCDNNEGPCTDDAKIAGLKAAAKRLIDIAVSDDQSRLTSKLALVPFSTRVRVGPNGGGGTIMTALTGMPATWSGWINVCLEGSGSGGSETDGSWSCPGGWQPQRQTDLAIMPCVTDRYYNSGNKFEATDEIPGPNAWLNAHDGSRMPKGWDSSNQPATSSLGIVKTDPANHWNYSPWGCADVGEGNEIMPLTSNKTALNARVDALEAYGSTAGALGTAWSWYVLSPNWSGIFTGASAPRSYSDLKAKAANGAPLLRKVAVLMTDGAYNTVRGWKGQDQKDVSKFAVDLCKNMKKEGIEIFTVGFTVGFALNDLPADQRDEAEQTLRKCGTDVSHFYNTLNTDQLYAAFTDIAVQLSAVRLTR